MDDDETKTLREAHVKAMRMLGEVEDLHDQTETMLAAFPGSILVRIAHALARLALWMGKRIEADAMADARETYERGQTP